VVVFYSFILALSFLTPLIRAASDRVVTAVAVQWKFGDAILGKSTSSPARDYQLHLPKGICTILTTVVLVAVFGFLASWLFNGPNSGVLSILFGPLVLILVFAVSMHAVKYFKFRAFEKKHNMLLMEDWAETGMVAVPKPPQNKQYMGLDL
jgi:hypothetical protein